MVGRTTELDRIATTLTATRETGSRCCILAGEVGIGKSRLAREAIARARSAGNRALLGHCLDLVDDVAFAPFSEALRELRVQHPRLGPLFGAPTKGDPTPADRTELLDAVAVALATSAEGRPILLALEDVHWSDPSTRDLVTYLAGRSGLPLLMLLTVRIEEAVAPGPIAAFLARLDERGAAERLVLAPLSREEVAEQLAAILRRQPDPGLVDRIHRRSDGNPLYAEELLGAALAGGGDALPPTLGDAILVRLARLPPEAQALLRVVAVGGRQVSHRLLGAVARRPDAVRSALRTLLQLRLLRSEPSLYDDAYAFHHALVREVLYTDLMPAERTELHATYAKVIAAEPTLLSEPVRAWAAIAHHREAAHDVPGARSARIEAARAAFRTLAFPEADAHYEHAFALTPSGPPAAPEADADLLTEAANAVTAAGRPARAVELIRQALALTSSDDHERRARLYRDLSNYLWLVGDLTSAAQASEEAVLAAELLPPSAGKAAALFSLASVHLVLGFLDRALVRVEDALAIARTMHVADTEALALGVLGALRALRGDEAEGLALARQGWHLARATKDLTTLALAGEHYQATTEIVAGEPAALALARDMLTDAEQRGNRHLTGGLHFLIGRSLARMGHWTDADRHYAIAAEADMSPSWHVILTAERAMLAASRGALLEAESLLSAGRDAVGTTQEVQVIVELTQAEAILALAEDRADSALAAVERALHAILPGARDAHIEPLLLLVGLRAAADLTEAERGRRTLPASLEVATAQETAQRLANEARAMLLPRAPARPGSVSRQLLVDQCEAELSRALRTDTAEQWARVADGARRAQQSPDRAYALLRQALAAARDPAGRGEALGAVNEAHELARSLGAVPLQRAIERFAQRARLRLRRAAQLAATPKPADGPAWGTLSPRELEVLALIAAGRSNRQIAETLFITERTAAAHVSHILVKLDVTSRAEAAIVGLQRGLVSGPASG